MAKAWWKKSKSSELALFTGFKTVRAVTNPNGGEKFGLIELAPEYIADVFTNPQNDRRSRNEEEIPLYTAALRLSGPSLNRWLADSKDDQGFFAALCQALPPDSPSQFLLRRRRGLLADHYEFIQQQTLQRMRDEEVARFFLQDYLDNLIYPVEDSGLANLWCGLLITGRSEEELTDRLARLVATLPCEATPCQAAELTRLLLDYFAPAKLDQPGENEEAPGDTLYSDWLAEVNYELVEDHTFNGEFATAYWTLSAPPLKNETGWTRLLLENESLTLSEFDITVHLSPAYQTDTMREVLERRVLLLEEQIQAALDAYHRDIAQELRVQQSEIQARLVGLMDEQHRYFEIGISIAMRAEPNQFNEECEVFAQELVGAGLAAHRTLTVSQTQAAFLDCAPLNLSRFDRPFVLPAPEAGRLAHIGTVGQPEQKVNGTLVGMSPAGEPVYLEPAQQPGQTTIFLTGEAGKASAQQAAALVRYMTAMRWFKGKAVYGLDRKGDWQWLVEKQGGRYIMVGANQAGYNFNPLEVTGDTLNQIGQLEGWVKGLGDFLAAILDLESELRDDLAAVLVEAAMARANRNEDFSAASLWIRAEGGGYLKLAEKLRQLGYNGRYGWLCSQPTRLPLPGQDDLLFISLAPHLRAGWSEEAQKYYFARLFARLAAYIGANQPTRPYLLLISEAQELLTDLPAGRSLAWLSQNAGKFGLGLWLLSPRSDEWINSYSGRPLFERAHSHIFFNQTGPGLAGAARRLNLSQRFLKTVREALPGAGVVRQLDEDGEPIQFAFDPLPGEFVNELGATPAQTVIVTEPVVTPKPIEVPLFAPDEIFGDETSDQIITPEPSPDEPAPLTPQEDFADWLLEGEDDFSDWPEPVANPDAGKPVNYAAG